MADGQQDVVRMYNVLPAIEQTKILIIERLKVLFDGINILFQNKINNRKDDEVIALVKATTISLYFMLKPKMIEHIAQREKIGYHDTMTEELKKMIGRIESTIQNPSQMSVEDALYFADIINVFCHEYGITRITYFAGTTTAASQDIYKIPQ
jgi:hypothetical protein